MAAQLIRIVLFSIITSSTNAQSTRAVDSPENTPVESIEYRDRVIKIAREEAALALKKLDANIKRCQQKEKRLYVSKFKNLGIPFEELMQALFHLSLEAMERCKGKSSFEHYLYTISRLEHTLRHYGTADKKINTMAAFQETAWRDIELKVKYNEMEPEHREALEAIPELSKPFTPFKQMDEIEAALKQ